MIYLWIKALHVAAAVLFVGGVSMQALLLGAQVGSPPPRLPQERRLMQRLRHWDRRVTSPAMVIVWIIGLGMASQAAWLGAPWLTLKMGLVLALSGLHGLQSGLLRQLGSESAQKVPSLARYSSAFVGVAVFGVVLLVVAKPFQPG